MSTDTAPRVHDALSRTAETKAGDVRRKYARLLSITVVALVVLAVAGAFAVSGQPPRVTSVLADPAAAATASGSRVIFTANQPVADVAAAQVSIEPAVGFSVETQGRSVGIRLDEALADGQVYRVSIDGVSAVGGGPSARFSVDIETPPAEAFLLERATEGDDRIYRAMLDEGERTTVFEHPHIEDFRASPRGLVVSVLDERGDSALLLVDASGAQVAEFRLPAVGRLSRLQLSDSGDRVAYTWTDPVVEGAPARDAHVYLSSIASPEDKPQALDLGDADHRVDDFRFVPGTTALLLVTRGDDLLLADPVAGGAPTRLGGATLIDDVARSEAVAFVRTSEGPERVDLRTGERTTLAAEHETFGAPFAAELIDGRGLLVTHLRFAESGALEGQTVVLTSEDGEERVIAELPVADAAVQVCAAPNGRFAAVVVAPDIASNPIDDGALAMPTTVETRIVALDGDAQQRTLPGFAISWCRAAAA